LLKDDGLVISTGRNNKLFFRAQISQLPKFKTLKHHVLEVLQNICGNKTVAISTTDISKLLAVSVSIESVRLAILELKKEKVIKSRINGRLREYTFDEFANPTHYYIPEQPFKPPLISPKLKLPKPSLPTPPGLEKKTPDEASPSKLPARKKKDQFPKINNKNNPMLSDSEAWEKTVGFMESISQGNKLYGWFKKSSHGVWDIQFTDYKNQACLLIHDFFKYAQSLDIKKGIIMSWLKFRLKEFMFTRRCIDRQDKSSDKPILIIPNARLQKHSKNNKNTRKFYTERIIEHLAVYIPKDPDEEKEEPDEDIKNPIYKQLYSSINALDPLEQALIKDYYTFEGITYSYKELAQKHNISVGYAHKLIKRSIDKLHQKLRSLKNETDKKVL
jgi:DNA-directed RNA polymerase specialized sigma24 family protein